MAALANEPDLMAFGFGDGLTSAPDEFAPLSPLPSRETVDLAAFREVSPAGGVSTRLGMLIILSFALRFGVCKGSDSSDSESLSI